ncbi:MAG: hypothetical protein ACI85I_000965 [Arenicella sp.]
MISVGIYSLIHLAVLSSFLNWHWLIYGIVISLILGKLYLNRQKQNNEINSRLKEVRKSISEWLLEKAKVNSYKVIADESGIQLFEDGEQSMFLAINEIDGFICDEEMIVISQDILVSCEKSFSFLKKSMREEEFSLLEKYIRTVLSDKTEYHYDLSNI